MKQSLLALTATATLFIACTPAPQMPKIPERTQAATLKPDSNSAAKVSITALGELSHIERAIKPFIGAAIPIPDEATGTTACRRQATTSAAIWETRWACGLDSKRPGRKEIEGVERVNYDRDKRILTYVASFEIRNFDDVEPRDQAHTLITERNIRIAFDASSVGGTGQAKILMKSRATMKGATAAPGSEWSSSMDTTLNRVASDWNLGAGTAIQFVGALYGTDGDRKNIFASGKFNFVSDSNIKLVDLGTANACTKPDGLWKLHASGGGENLDTSVATSTQGGQIYAGATFAWPTDLCDQP